MALHEFTRDLSGRPYLGYDLQIPTQRVGKYDTQLVEHFFQSLANTSGMTLQHSAAQLAGRNSHHIIEATFKAFARALRQATDYDPRRLGTVPRFDFLFSSVTSLASKASPLVALEPSRNKVDEWCIVVSTDPEKKEYAGRKEGREVAAAYNQTVFHHPLPVPAAR
ncbi:hypothetical protein NC651_023431 [Populus alba x Populus x berolinensis]|nr:hypothetical protein NC651_023431 [Populus alba x Populus x berolinensis]